MQRVWQSGPIEGSTSATKIGDDMGSQSWWESSSSQYCAGRRLTLHIRTLRYVKGDGDRLCLTVWD